MKSNREKIDKAFKLAKDYLASNGNCAQCVFAAVTETLGMESADAFRSCTGFADGVGMTGNGHCGAISGAVMAIGYIYGRKREDFPRRGKMMKTLMLTRQLQNRFMEEHGSCICQDLQTKFFGRFFNLLEPSEVIAANQAGLLDKCSLLSGQVARITTELILDQQEKDAATK